MRVGFYGDGKEWYSNFSQSPSWYLERVRLPLFSFQYYYTETPPSSPLCPVSISVLLTSTPSFVFWYHYTDIWLPPLLVNCHLRSFFLLLICLCKYVLLTKTVLLNLLQLLCVWSVPQHFLQWCQFKLTVRGWFEKWSGFLILSQLSFTFAAHPR